MTLPAPRLCCLDLDTFFVSVERLFDPSLEGKPVVVGGRPGQRGVVTAASYEVRAYGVHSGMSLTEAARLAPHAIFVPPRHGVYGDCSSRVRAIAERFCPLVRMASIDEMYLDFSGCERLYQRTQDASFDATIERTVWQLTGTIQRELGLPASVGIGTSKSVAKIASGLAKPRGVLLVPAGSEQGFLAPLPVRKFPGIGPVAEGKLMALGIRTLGDLAKADLRRLERLFGSLARSLREGARGIARSHLGRERPAFREHDPEGGVVGSISNERTFREDVHDATCIEAMLGSLCERVCWRARRRGVVAKTVTLKLRYADFHTITRSRSMGPTNAELTLYPVVLGLYRHARRRRMAVRLLGVALTSLRLGDEQRSLFEEDRMLFEAVDDLRERYGYDVVRVASALRSRRGEGRS